jgi:hypothetical protein
MRPQGVTVRRASPSHPKKWEGTGETLHATPAGFRPDDERPNANDRGDRLLDRVFAHLRAQVAELRHLESAGAKQEDLEEHRALVGQLQEHLAEVVRTTLTDVNRSDRR